MTRVYRYRYRYHTNTTTPSSSCRLADKTRNNLLSLPLVFNLQTTTYCGDDSDDCGDCLMNEDDDDDDEGYEWMKQATKDNDRSAQYN